MVKKDFLDNYRKRVTVLFDPSNSLGAGCVYSSPDEMPISYGIEKGKLLSMNLLVEDPESFADSAMKHRYLRMLGEKGYAIPITIFREKRVDPVTVASPNSVKKVSANEAFEILQSAGVKKIVTKPTYSCGGVFIDFLDLNSESFNDAIEKSPTRIVQSYVIPKEKEAREYRFIVADNKCCASYSMKSGRFDLTNLSMGGTPEKVKDKKVKEELEKLAEKITMEFKPTLKFASVDFLDGKDGFCLGEVHRFGRFEWKGYMKLHGDDKEITKSVCSMVEKYIGDGAVGWTQEHESVLSFWNLNHELSTNFPFRTISKIEDINPMKI